MNFCPPDYICVYPDLLRRVEKAQTTLATRLFYTPSSEDEVDACSAKYDREIRRVLLRFLEKQERLFVAVNAGTKVVSFDQHDLILALQQGDSYKGLDEKKWRFTFDDDGVSGPVCARKADLPAELRLVQSVSQSQNQPALKETKPSKVVKPNRSEHGDLVFEIYEKRYGPHNPDDTTWDGAARWVSVELKKMNSKYSRVSAKTLQNRLREHRKKQV